MPRLRDERHPAEQRVVSKPLWLSLLSHHIFELYEDP
jgi:hypothetical protein